MKEESIAAVVVTYNRKALLLECLNAIMNQSIPVNRIILIDNASTDGTKEALAECGILQNPTLEYKLMEKNTGGSGGFYEGLKISREYDYDWIWVMDDDTIPSQDCLANLIEAKEIIKKENGTISFLASAIYGQDGEFMNVPNISEKESANGYPYWYGLLSEGIVNICDATFVSILINRQAIMKCGLPNRDYFIWGDDSEYTTRLTYYFGDAYLVGKSIAIHKRKNASSLRISNETDKKRIKLFYYSFRNSAVNDRYYKKKKYCRLRCIKNVLTSIRYLKEDNGVIKALTVARGSIAGLMQYNRFKRYIDDQLKIGT